jgi:hypothetical protein
MTDIKSSWDGTTVTAAGSKLTSKWDGTIATATGPGGSALDADPYQLPDSAADIVIANGSYQQLPLARLTANRAPVVQITGMSAGQLLRIQRLDVGAFTYTLTSGGPGLGTLVACPANCGFDIVLELVAGDLQVNQLSLYSSKKVGNAGAVRGPTGDCDFAITTTDQLKFTAAYATPTIDAGQRATAGTAEDATAICRKGATPGTDAGGNWVTRWAQEVGGISSASKYVAGVDGATAVGQHDYFSGYFRTLAAGTKPMLFQSGAQIVLEASIINEWSIVGPTQYSSKTIGAAYSKVWAAAATSVRYEGATGVGFQLKFDKLGFGNTTPITIPTVSGAKAGNAALTSLISQLAALGLIVDTTT